MQHKKMKLSVILFLVTGIAGLQAQQTTLSSGGDASGAGGSSSYSVGQVVYNVDTGTDGTVTQGVQQPYEIYIYTGIEEANDITLTVTAYPNPASDKLTLKILNYNISSLYFLLSDINGKFIENKEITSNETIIDMSKYMSAVYFLKVMDCGKELKTFKIIKN
jgi:hypothetical protein